jgi:hypothetical protein
MSCDREAKHLHRGNPTEKIIEKERQLVAEWRPEPLVACMVLRVLGMNWLKLCRWRVFTTPHIDKDIQMDG